MRISIDSERPLREQPGSGHNRWHPDIEPIARVEPGAVVVLETRDSLDGQVAPDSTHADLQAVDIGLAHPLTGPIHVAGAEPGAVLEVAVLEIEPSSFGFTSMFPGFGLLPDELQEPYLVKWELEPLRARSSDIPGVTIPAAPFAGVVGVAPSHALMEQLLEREREVAARGGPVVDAAPESALPADAAWGLRTIPCRELGGNLDVKALTAGSRLFLPVHVPGALVSLGDVHFAQGDGEVCGDAIEMAATVTVRLVLHTRPSWWPHSAAYMSDDRPTGRFLATTGVPVTADRPGPEMDLTVAARAALGELVDCLCGLMGYDRKQAYALASVAADLRINQVVNVPNPTVSARLPLDIFDDEPVLP